MRFSRGLLKRRWLGPWSSSMWSWVWMFIKSNTVVETDRYDTIRGLFASLFDFIDLVRLEQSVQLQLRTNGTLEEYLPATTFGASASTTLGPPGTSVGGKFLGTGASCIVTRVKSSQVVGLRDCVAIIRTLIFSSPHPYAGSGEVWLRCLLRRLWGLHLWLYSTPPGLNWDNGLYFDLIIDYR